jgi:hypothetical protein
MPLPPDQDTPPPPLILRPQSPEEASLTIVETLALRATLERQTHRDPNVGTQIVAARVKSREFSHYGFFTNLIIPPSASAAARGILERGTGSASIGFRNSDAPTLAMLTFSTDGRLEFLEAFPVDGAGWPADECIKLLQAPLSAVYIISESGKDYAAATA